MTATKTLDVERAEKWLEEKYPEYIWGRRYLAQLLHDYALSANNDAMQVMLDAEDDIFGHHPEDALDKLRRFLVATPAS